MQEAYYMYMNKLNNVIPFCGMGIYCRLASSLIQPQ